MKAASIAARPANAQGVNITTIVEKGLAKAMTVLQKKKEKFKREMCPLSITAVV